MGKDETLGQNVVYLNTVNKYIHVFSYILKLCVYQEFRYLPRGRAFRCQNGPFSISDRSKLNIVSSHLFKLFFTAFSMVY